jgi:hypothetical protein
MSIVPSTDIGRITFYEAHVPGWSLIPTQIGLLAADCTALGALLTTARKAYNDQQTALEAAKAATNTMHNAVLALHALGSADIAKIKAYAEVSHNMNVYPLANLPMPATPSPVGPPGTPESFVVGLTVEGFVTLKWKCSNPSGASGTTYEIRRRIGTESSFVYLATEGKRSFTDETLPGGSSGVTYMVTALRSTKRGEPAQCNVNFGVGGGGSIFIASTSEGVKNGEVGGMKMAA